MTLSRKYLDELVVYGYLRRSKECKIPEDIMKICNEWYHVGAYFECWGSGIDMNEDKNILKSMNKDWKSVYANVIMNKVYILVRVERFVNGVFLNKKCSN